MTRKRDVITWFAFWSVVGLMNFSYRWLDLLVRSDVEPFYEKFIEEVTGAWGTGLMMVGIVLFARAASVRAVPWHRVLLTHVALMPVYSIAHTSWNWSTRVAAYAVFGLGSYDYGLMQFRFLMEFPNDLLNYFILASLIHLYMAYRQGRDRQVRLAELETELKAAQLDALSGQLRPHFLFNALNTVSSVMYRNVEEADRVLQRLGDLLRRSLQGGDKQYVALREELRTLDLYLDIMRARFGDRLDVSVDADPSTLDTAVPSFVLQPLVENALEHGDPGPGITARVRVTAKRNADRLHIAVRDNGPGIPAARGGDRVGIGLTNTRDRLHRLYGPGEQLRVDNAPDGGCVATLHIPLLHGETSR